jgi:hypothetical protein
MEPSLWKVAMRQSSLSTILHMGAVQMTFTAQSQHELLRKLQKIAVFLTKQVSALRDPRSQLRGYRQKIPGRIS